MQILSLHDLCCQQLPHLLEARYMPHGWNREADRRATKTTYACGKTLDKVLAQTKDRLVPRPPQERLKELLRAAASERTLDGMVLKMVELMQGLPEVDQADACAAAEIADHTRELWRLRSFVESARDDAVKRAEKAKAAGVPLDDLVQELNTVLAAIQTREGEFEHVLARLEDDLQHTP